MRKLNIRWLLVVYDILILFAVDFAWLVILRNGEVLSFRDYSLHTLVLFLCVFTARFFSNIYKQIWRYGGVQCYIRLIFSDGLACLFCVFAEYILRRTSTVSVVSMTRIVSILCVNLFVTLTIRMVYRYAYKCSNDKTVFGKFLNLLLLIFAGAKSKRVAIDEDHKIKIAIIGAGRVGVSLAEELLANVKSSYLPRCFVDINAEKVNREIHGIPVILESKATAEQLKCLEVQEVVFAIPDLDEKKKKDMCDLYLRAGFRIKVYDFPIIHTAGQKRHMREFDIEELLFRKAVEITDKKTTDYYKNKVILITGGGGSIGSELCRQLAKMHPERIVIIDIYENGAYDVQQELKIAYGESLKVDIEICSITDKKALSRVFAKYNPQIVINAAAHKHVPLMENNCVEAVKNNVFGTMNIVELSEEYEAERFMMVSTDKAVNPTNVMGATKRMCEMLVRSASVYGKVKYSSTRFGNVLGSAGSVIPLFKKQIANGGPVTLTDRRIVRYFMTIPEASQLVLQSGAMAENGELFVLDMGKPVKILDLAENMIRMSGRHDIEIVETGLRPGEKLYEELLVNKRELEKTSNELIFIEKDEAIDKEKMREILDMLKRACDFGDDNYVRTILKKVVPTYRLPDEVNMSFTETNKVLAEKIV